MFSKLRKTLHKNEFYRDSYRRVMWLALGSLALNIVMVFVLLFATGGHGNWYFYATTNNGKLLQLQTRNLPILSDSAVLSWVNRVVPQLYTMNFLNYRQKINEKSIYFTGYGWNQFLKAFQPTLETIRANDYAVTAAPADVPVITRKGVFEGKFMWQVQVPLIISYQHGAKEATQNVVWTLLLQKRDNTKSTQLLGIDQVVQVERGSNGD